MQNKYFAFQKGGHIVETGIREPGGGRVETEKISDPVLQNLKDAGCPGETICAFADSKDMRQRPAVLTAHRKKLLDGIHAEQKKLDCLDYLIFKMRKEMINGKEFLKWKRKS